MSLFLIKSWKKPVLTGFFLLILSLSLFGQSSFSGNWYIFSNAQIGHTSFETGESFSSTYLYSGFRFYSSKFSFTFSLPMIYQRGSGFTYDSSNVFTNPDFNMQNPGSLEEFHNSGLGDAYITFDYILHNSLSNRYQISVSVESKIPTASSGFGTGKFDFGGYLTLRKYIRSYFVLINAGYQVMGDTETIQFENPVILGAGIGNFVFNYKLGIFIYYEHYSSWILNADPPQYSVFGISYKLNPKIFVSSYAQKGFSDSSPDLLFSFGIDLKIK